MSFCACLTVLLCMSCIARRARFSSCSISGVVCSGMNLRACGCSSVVLFMLLSLFCLLFVTFHGNMSAYVIQIRENKGRFINIALGRHSFQSKYLGFCSKIVKIPTLVFLIAAVSTKTISKPLKMSTSQTFQSIFPPIWQDKSKTSRPYIRRTRSMLFFFEKDWNIPTRRFWNESSYKLLLPD